MGQSSSIIQKHLQKISQDIRITFSNSNTLQDLCFSKTKDRLPLLKNTNVIYKIPCSNCSSSYIGETLQHLSKRVTRHKSDEKKHKKDNSKSLVDGTALAQHARDKNHSFDFDNILILAKENNIKKRKIREIVEILKNDTCNFKSDSQNLCAMYGDVLKKSL